MCARVLHCTSSSYMLSSLLNCIVFVPLRAEGSCKLCLALFGTSDAANPDVALATSDGAALKAAALFTERSHDS